MIRFSTLLIVTITFASSFLYLISFKPADKNLRSRIASEMDKSIQTELLNKWYPQSLDLQYGGFLSAFTFDFKPIGSQDKMIVTQARHTWSNAKAAQFYPQNSSYKKGAQHGFIFLRDVMWDKKYGGFYTLVDRQGNIKNSEVKKDAYGNAFAIYALAAYYQSSGDTSALNLAKQAFMWLENHSHDKVYKGYYQHMQIDGTPIKRDINTPSASDLGYKDQNSSIHLLEAFTELYSVWPDSLLKERLQEMLFLIRDTITTKKGYLILFLQPDWTPVDFRNSSEAVISKHHKLDHVSFGHDVETAYLMLEASHTLGIENNSATMNVAKKMIDHALQNGWDNKVGGFYDEGYYFKANTHISIIKDTKNWWAQAEGLNTLLLMADHFPDDELNYFQKFQTQWKYIQQYLIDHKYGDWYQGGLDKEPEQKTALKGHIWKGNYHQFRALANCVLRLQPDTINPTIPKNLDIKQVNNGAVLKWDPASDNKRLLGYNIYKNGIKTGFTPKTDFFISSLEKLKGNRFYIRSIDLQHNESASSSEVSY